jgi:trimeric autotransporter adhesin
VRLLRGQPWQRAYFLDGRTDVAASYSLRRLRRGYTGPLVRLRRSSDSAEEDFYGTNWLEYATVLAWANGSNVFVVTWYDQSGNGRNLTQSTASAQPQLILAGNGKPALLFDGSNDYIRSGAFTLNQPHTRYSLFRLVTVPGSGEAHIVSGRALTDGLVFYVASGTVISISAGTTTTVGNAGMPGGARGVVAAVFNGASSLAEINAASTVSSPANVGSNNLTGLTVGTRGDLGSSNFANVEIQELIEFGSAHTQTEAQSRNAAIRKAWGF